jgi:hypothetical protein
LAVDTQLARLEKSQILHLANSLLARVSLSISLSNFLSDFVEFFKFLSLQEYLWGQVGMIEPQDSQQI